MEKTINPEEIGMLNERVKRAERLIQSYKGLVNKFESKATGYEERLGMVKREGEYRP